MWPSACPVRKTKALPYCFFLFATRNLNVTGGLDRFFVAQRMRLASFGVLSLLLTISPMVDRTFDLSCIEIGFSCIFMDRDVRFASVPIYLVVYSRKLS